VSTQNAKPTGARRLVLLLAAVLTFAATVLLGLTTADVASATTTSTAAGSSSASTVPAPETCVGASTAGLISGVWGRTDITAGQRRDGPRSQLQIVSGHCVAAEDGTGSIPGLKDGWQGRTADNGKGWVWQEPGSPGNANSLRVMDPTPQYPNGYTRFYNGEGNGQPLGLDGKPGPRSATHIPRSASGGDWPIPEGW
jgi:hypothetical protein